jgi:cytolysin (calcineurin-like family phosphatase)
MFQTAAALLKGSGWTLRSGGAEGADLAFERGANGTGHIYLPWQGFNGHELIAHNRSQPQSEAYNIAAQFHPAWDRCSQGAKRLHARNVHQVLGDDVTNPILSKFVVCWTPDGSGSGGTGQAIRIAQHYGVPVIDTGAQDGADRLIAFLTKEGS